MAKSPTTFDNFLATLYEEEHGQRQDRQELEKSSNLISFLVVYDLAAPGLG